MRIASLGILAYGHFTDRRLEFSPSPLDFHLVYGPNEAGKTTALEALRDLLFGIGGQTKYGGFVHSYTEMRVGGVLESDGTLLEVTRRKGNKNTLLDSEGKPCDESVLSAVLGGVDRERFRRMYALTHEDLVEGGQEIVQGEGDVGRTLFAAGEGGVHLSRALAETRERAETLFTARAQVKPLNEALKRAADLGGEIRGCRLKGQDWLSARTDLEEARVEETTLRQRAGELRSEQTRLVRLRQTIPLLGRRRELHQALEQLGNVVALPEDFEARLADAAGRRDAAQRAIGATRARAAQTASDIEGIELPEALLQREGELEALSERAGSHRKAWEDRTKLLAEQRTLEADIRELLSQLPGAPDAEGAARLLPDAAIRATLVRLSGDRGRLDDQMQKAARELADCQEQIGRLQGDLERAPARRDPADLRLPVTRARRLGDPEAELRRLELELQKQDTLVTQQLGSLGLEGSSACTAAAMAVPLAATVEDYRRRGDGLAARADELAKELNHNLRALEDRHQDIRRLETEGVVPLETDLAEARELRDRGWALLKQHYILGDPQDLTAYAPDGDAAGVYEGTVRDADAVSDVMRRESERVGHRAALQAGIQAIEERIARVQGEQEALDGELGAFEADWRGRWEGVPVAVLSPAEMLQWLTALETLRQSVQRREGMAAELEDRRRLVERERLALVGALRKIGETIGEPPPPLSDVLERAEEVLTGVQEGNDRLERLTERLEELNTQRERRAADLEQVTQRLAQWEADWRRAVASLALGDAPPVEQVTVVLNVLQQFSEKQAKVDAVVKRVAGIDKDAEEFSLEVGELVGLLAPDCGKLTPEDAVRELHKRLKKAVAASARLEGLLQQDREEQEALRDQGERLREALADLGDLARLAGCPVPELRAAWERHRQREALLSTLGDVEGGLETVGEGKALAELAQEAEGADTDAVKADLEALGVELEELEKTATAQTERVGGLRQAFNAMDGSRAAADLAEQRQRTLAQVREMAEEYLALQVARHWLDKAMETYRAENQTPVLARAGDILSNITLGAFQGLKLDFGDADRPLLVGERPDGRTVGVEGMSDGTCDQLFLALRLAAIRQAPPLPFVADDILIRFDDDRAKATLEELGRLAAETQVIFFTHHRRLKELADSALGEACYGYHELYRP